MKAFWISLILFALLLMATAGNALYIRRVTDRIYAITESLSIPEARADSLAELETLWKKQEPWIGLTVGFRELDHFGELIVQLRWAQDTQNEAELLRYRALLRDAIKELRRAEEFSVENLF